MKRNFLPSIFYFLSSIFLGGCLIRTYTMEKPRLDLEITGNQGYLVGSAPANYQSQKKLSSTRKITVVEVELGQHQPKNASLELPPQEVSLPENLQPRQGMKEEEDLSEQVILEEPQTAPVSSERSFSSFKEEPSSERYTLYTVQKNDTLQKISYKFFNTTKKWQKIYELNKDVLKGADKIYPGQVLKIPKN